MKITAFDSFKIGNLLIPNRIVRSATAERIAMQGEADGHLLGEKYAELAKGGVGLIISGHIAVHASGRLYSSMPSFSSESDLHAWRMAVRMTHAAGGKLFLQINHGGGRCFKGAGEAAICVSPLPDFPKDPMQGMELDDTKIHELIMAFAEAAGHAREAGADGVQIHAAHGYLVSQFLSPLTNLRHDDWGVSLEHRAKFLVMALRGVRKTVGEDFPIGIKLGVCDDDPAGLKLEETLQVAKWAEADGLDFVEISGAFRKDLALRHVKPGVNEGYYLPFAARFKQELKIPVFVVGGWRSLEKMNEALSSGQCDAVSMSRPLICQPDYPDVLRAGGKTLCRSCNLCLLKQDGPTKCYSKK